MRVLVTGANGVIGSTVAAARARAGHAVTGVARNPVRQGALGRDEVSTANAVAQSFAIVGPPV